MDLQKNYYQILELNKNASIEEIKKNFRKLSIKYHPDKTNGDKQKEEKFKSISDAYNILGNKDKKQQYDVRSPHGKNYNPNPFGGFGVFSEFGDFDNIFDTFFNRTYKKQNFNENLDIVINLHVSLRNVYVGKPLEVSYNRNIHCDECNGTGFDKNSNSYECDMCSGKGKHRFGRKCEYCQGVGKIYSGTCKKCNGEKVIKNFTKFNLNKIYNIKSSKDEYIRGYGHQSKYYRNKKGDLKLRIIYQHDNNYIIENNKLIYNLNLHYQDAIDGIKYEYISLDDKILKISIPKNTKDKDLIRIRDKGLLLNDNKRDDLYFKINIIIDYDRL